MVSDTVLKSLIDMVGHVVVDGAFPVLVVIISHRRTRRTIRREVGKIDDKMDSLRTAYDEQRQRDGDSDGGELGGHEDGPPLSPTTTDREVFPKSLIRE